MSTILENISERILFEDNHILIINKKAGELVQGDKTKDIPLLDHLKNFIAQRDKKPGAVFLGLTHRIDRPVSGIVVFAKTSKALARINALFQEKKIQKVYWAIVKQTPKKTTDKLQHYLLKNEKQNKSYVVDVTKKEAKLCELTYTVLLQLKQYALLEVMPHTGRHHQIRCLLAAIQSPIKGDLKYGFDRSNSDGSIHLHARKIIFIHPVTQKKISVVAEVPLTDALWQATRNYSE